MLTAGHLRLDEDEIRTLCERYHVRELALFGSVLREDYDAESDVDVLVDFEPTACVTLLDVGGLQMDLQDLFGRPVDVVTMTAATRSRLRHTAVEGRTVIYAKSAPE